MKRVITLLLFSSLLACTNAQRAFTPRLAGAPCEGCEAVLEYGDRDLTATTTFPDFEQAGVKIKVHGTIYNNDGKTPAPNVILYAYHTNQEGVYPPGEGAQGWARRHGYLRAWAKTDEQGQYAFFTLKPAPYPNRPDPAHIHYTILEPNGKYYWLESCYFAGDPRLTEKDIHPDAPRGGTPGVLHLKKEGELYVGKRDIILGENIPQYE